jgi:L-ascorbate metabolism protein UlaG (beta-lactamase superfamily)
MAGRFRHPSRGGEWRRGPRGNDLGTGLATARRFVHHAPEYWDRYSSQRQRPVEPAPACPRWQDWPDVGVHAAWVGHSTVLMKIDGMTIITDPVFSERCGVRFGPVTIGLKRLVEPALRIPHLPHVDVILLSHAHMDHFDLPSLRALEGRGTRVVTARSTSDLLRVERYGAVDELGWGEGLRVGPLSIRGLQVKHWGARMRTDTYRGYNGYLIEAGRYRVLFGGDTADTREFKNVRTSRRIDLALMPIGAYNPWIFAHCTPEQALRMCDDAGAEHVLPLHHQTFALSREPLSEPIERLLDAAGAHGDRVMTRGIGDEGSLS